MKAAIFYGHPDQVQTNLNMFLDELVTENSGQENQIVRAKNIHEVVQSESAITENAEGIEKVKSITLTILWD